MRMVLLGPPGSGKGTQAARMASAWSLPHLTTGDMLRAAVRDGTELGQLAEGYMNAGQLVPDDVMIGLIRERCEGADCAQGFILDGFPRTVVQAEALDGLLQDLGTRIDGAILFEVPEDEVIRRIAGRRTCRACGAGYHVEFQPPREPGRCDRCGSEVVQRADDTDETIRTRLKVYAEVTSPLSAYYERHGRLRRLAAIGHPDAVFARIEQLAGR